MCPFCEEHDGKACTIAEKPNGRIVCSCGRHSWPNAGVFLESVRKKNLKITGFVHTWTQSY